MVCSLDLINSFQPKKGKYVLYQQWVRFIIAIQFLTRIPCHNLVAYDAKQAQQAPLFYPLVGALIGVFSFAIFSVFTGYINDTTAILISMIATIWLTGALHEDGFADCCDGFGGGWKKHDILRIMKDSRLGAYGAIGLICILALKYQLLIDIPAEQLCIAFVLGHAFSRFFATSFMYSLSYAQTDSESKVQSHITALDIKALSIAFIPVLLLLLWLPLLFSLILTTALFILYLFMKQTFTQKIDGYTGDCLGAAQQISEVMIYLCLTIYF